MGFDFLKLEIRNVRRRADDPPRRWQDVPEDGRRAPPAPSEFLCYDCACARARRPPCAASAACTPDLGVLPGVRPRAPRPLQGQKLEMHYVGTLASNGTVCFSVERDALALQERLHSSAARSREW